MAVNTEQVVGIAREVHDPESISNAHRVRRLPELRVQTNSLLPELDVNDC